MTTKKRRICIICGGKTFSLINQIHGVKILECQKCSLAHTGQIREKKKDLYRKKSLYNLKLYSKYSDLQTRKFEEIIIILRDFIKEGRVLEVGAGYGLFASLLQKDSRFQTQVLEPNLKTVYLNKLKNKIRAYKKTYQNFLAVSKQKFDLVTFLDVLEHFDNPKLILSNTKRILTKNGLVLILLPNYKSLMAKMSKNWSWWMVEDHRYHFSPWSLKLILEKSGYEIKYMTTFENFFDFKKNLDGNFSYIRNSVERKTKKVLFFALFLPSYFLFRKLIWSLGLGGLTCVVASRRV